MKNIEFTDQEINALLQLIDMAVKAGGLNVAQASAVLADKLTSAVEGGPQEVEHNPLFAEPANLEPVEEGGE